MANERALGLSFIYAAQTWRQLSSIFGETEARALFGLTNVRLLFGGSKDVAFNKEISDLAGLRRVRRTSYQQGSRHSRTVSGEDVPVIRPAEVRELPPRHALVIAENAKPIVAKLQRCIDGKSGRQLLAAQARVRAAVHATQDQQSTAGEREGRAREASRRLGLAVDEHEQE